MTSINKVPVLSKHAEKILVLVFFGSTGHEPNSDVFLHLGLLPLNLRNYVSTWPVREQMRSLAWDTDAGNGDEAQSMGL